MNEPYGHGSIFAGSVFRAGEDLIKWEFVFLLFVLLDVLGIVI